LDIRTLGLTRLLRPHHEAEGPPGGEGKNTVIACPNGWRPPPGNLKVIKKGRRTVGLCLTELYRRCFMKRYPGMMNPIGSARFPLGGPRNGLRKEFRNIGYERGLFFFKKTSKNGTFDWVCTWGGFLSLGPSMLFTVGAALFRAVESRPVSKAHDIREWPLVEYILFGDRL